MSGPDCACAAEAAIRAADATALATGKIVDTFPPRRVCASMGRSIARSKGAEHVAVSLPERSTAAGQRNSSQYTWLDIDGRLWKSCTLFRILAGPALAPGPEASSADSRWRSQADRLNFDFERSPA
jgi:hypothetical protein